AILRAIRNGQFYNVLKNTDLHFNNISNNNDTISVTLTKTATIKFKTATREVIINNANQANLTITNTDIYVRVEATDGNDTIYSQALMYEGISPQPIKNALVKNRSILI